MDVPSFVRERCVDCGFVLTDEERHYYECRCESCEVEAHETLQAWRAGRDEPPETMH